MLQWILDRPEVLAAASTVLLAVFAAVQIGLEIHRNHRAAQAAKIEVKGPAWLARRTLEQAVFAARSYKDVFQWARQAGSKDGLDRIEQQMLAVLRIGATAKGQVADSSEAAFESFLAYADRLNAVNSFVLTGNDGGGGRYVTDEDREGAHALAQEGLQHLRSGIDTLAALAPRRSHEKELPEAGDVRFLREAASQQRQASAGG